MDNNLRKKILSEINFLLKEENRKLQQGLEITADNIKFVLDNYEKWNKDMLFISRGVQYDDAAVSYKKFVNFAKRLFESLKNLFGFDNKSAVHKAFKNVMSGPYERMGNTNLVNFVSNSGASMENIKAGLEKINLFLKELGTK